MSVLSTTSKVGWRKPRGVRGKGQVQRDRSNGGDMNYSNSRVYSKVHITAERDTTWGLGVRVVGEGSREGMGRGHRQR